MKKVLRNLRIVYYSIYVAAIISATLGFFLLKSGVKIDPLSDAGVVINSILIIFIIGSVPITLGLFHFSTKKWAMIENNEIKLKKYQFGGILRLAILGLGLVLGVLFFYLFQPSSQAQSMIFCAGIAAIGVFFCKPADVKIISELKLEDSID